MPTVDPRLGMLVEALDEAFERASWHGPNLRSALRGVPAKEAIWRPAPGRHNIWELALHAAYWKYVLRRRITGAKKGSFILKGSNFFPREDASEKEWKLDLLILENEHRELRAAVEALNPKLLDQPLSPRWTYLQIIRGAAAHDLYHAGQIQLLKKLYSR